MELEKDPEECALSYACLFCISILNLETSKGSQTGPPGGLNWQFGVLIFEANVFVASHSDAFVYHTLQLRADPYHALELAVDHSHIFRLAADHSHALQLGVDCSHALISHSFSY